MRYTKQRNPGYRGRVEVAADGAIVVFSDGNSFSLDKDQLDAVLSLEMGAELETEAFVAQRLVETILPIPGREAINIYILEEGPMRGNLMIVSLKGLRRAARLVAQEQV